MKYYASLSYGKDSLAMLEAIHQLDYPLDGIIHAEVWATDDIPAELPEMVEFKAKADRIIKKRYGIDVEHVCAVDKDGSKMTFEGWFYRIREKSPERGIYGWPFQRGRYCTSSLKTKVLDKACSQGISYVGIAADETERIDRKANKQNVLPLVDIGWTEEDCMRWCEENGLVSPVYLKSSRGGCWFCPMQSLGDLRNLYSEHPELWELMLKWDADSPVSFRSKERTVRDYDKRFKAENLGLVPKDRRFRWKMLDAL